ncbi:MAG: c-type cytochrome biogenesis protein CcsB [Streptosporangiales bacterium]|nr:c-type cytochrome biogenesis protein CcsB [Streptosporangiales bacterium]
MPGDLGLAGLSDGLMTTAVVVYSLAMLGYAGEFALGRGRARTPAAAGTRVLVGAGPPAEDALPEDAETGRPRPRDVGVLLGRAAVALTVLGWAFHLTQILTRGLAAQRWPWGNMHEFTSALAFSAVTALLVLLYRHRVRYLGLFVLLPVVLGLELASTVLYTAVGPLVPALNSYWIAIHVTAAVIAAGCFTAASAAAVLYLVVDRYERQRSLGRTVGMSGIAGALPGKEVLDRLAYRTLAFGFPIWTFAIIAGAIWAEAAWGRYWGWDPKETWSFITWIVYAGYLHARVTAGWRGRRLAIVALIGFGCFLFNFFGVNIWVVGLHSYAGL